MPIIESKFKPAGWLRNPHMQTLWASKVRQVVAAKQTPERLELPDGDFLDTNWSLPVAKATTDADRENPAAVPTEVPAAVPGSRGIVCLFHGLGGSIQSAYATAAFNVLEKAGFQVAFLHFRGCSGEPNRLAKAYHSGATDDIRYFIKLAAHRSPGKPIHAVGFSLGANALLKYLGEEGSSCLLKSAIAVAPPLVLQEGANKLNTGFARIYQRYLLDAMKNHLEEKRQRYPHLNLPNNVSAIKTFWQFDDGVTAHLHGFADVHDYYSQSSSRQYLPAIACHTHIIHALDDPFFTPAVVPDEQELSKQTTLELSRYGGHVGFVAGNNPTGNRYWLDQRIPELLVNA